MRRYALALIPVVALVVACSSSAPSPTTTTTTTTLAPSPPTTSMVSVVGGTSHTCALRSDATVWCWGYNGYGQLGFATASGTSTPVTTPGQVTGLTGVTALTAGANHTCAVLTSGQVACWGKNEFGQLGNSTNNNSSMPNPAAAIVTGLSGVAGVAGGTEHTCAWTGSGVVSCWGDNQSGGLGNSTNTTLPSANPVPAVVAGVSGVTDVAASDRFNCAVVTGSTVTCWGRNGSGQMGNSTNIGSTAANLPAPVSGISGVVELAAGSNHVCARTSAGAIWCWGLNSAGQLGNLTNNGSFTSNPTPLASAVSSGAVEVSAGGNFTCARSAGTMACWGINLWGQLGTGTNSGTQDANPVPIIVTGVSVPSGIGLGPTHSCAVASGAVWCWGHNNVGQTGNPTNTTDNPTPTMVAGL